MSDLILEGLIEKGYFGNDWEDFLNKTINEMANQVLYDPKEIDYTPNPESQAAQNKYELVLKTLLLLLYGFDVQISSDICNKAIWLKSDHASTGIMKLSMACTYAKAKDETVVSNFVEDALNIATDYYVEKLDRKDKLLHNIIKNG